MACESAFQGLFGIAHDEQAVTADIISSGSYRRAGGLTLSGCNSGGHIMLSCRRSSPRGIPMICLLQESKQVPWPSSIA